MGPRTDLIARRLQVEGDKMSAYLRSLPQDAWERQIYPGDDGNPWDLRQLLWHLLSAERSFHLLLNDILGSGEGAPPDLDVDDLNAQEVAKLGNESPADLLEVFQAARQANIELAQTILDSDLDRRGRHPYLGWTDLEAFFKLIYRHDMLHIRDVKRKVG